MQFIEMSDYNRGARAYWWATTFLGALTIGFALTGVLRLNKAGMFEVAAVMAVVYLAGLFPIRIPGTHSMITPVDIFIFLAATYLGASAATLVAVTDAFTVSCRKSQRWTSRLGGPAIMAISVFVSATVFNALLDWLNRMELFNGTMLLTALLLFSILYFSLNTLLLASSYALKQRKALFPLWWSNYCWTSVTYAASASTAGVISLAIKNYGLMPLLAAGPVVAVIFATCYFYFKQSEERAKSTERIGKLHLATVEALATAIDAKDTITHDHVYRVQVYACGLGRYFGLNEAEIEALKAGALLHDVGKIAVPDYILNKPGKLTAAEFEKMKIHTIVGAQILERVGFPYPVVPIVRHHHERWDGRGYPDGLRGEQIPMTARILTVTDCFDAVREDRQYRKGMTREEACQLLRDGVGKQFDPAVVEAFLANLPKYEAEIVAHKESQQPLLSPTTQAGLSEGGRDAVPAAGLAQSTVESPDYIKQISAAHAEVATLYEMAQNSGASLNVKDAVALTVTHIKRMIPFTTCAFYLRQDDDSAVAAYVFGQNAERMRGSGLAPGRGIVGWVIINGQPMHNTDPMLDLNDFPGAAEAGYRAAAVYPLNDGDKTLGALAVYSNELDAYGSNHLHLLESMARFASTSLQHAILYEQTKVNAQVDALTGMPNGRALYEHAEEEITRAQEEGTPLQVLSLNITGMRAVNYAYGYQAGDRLLAEVASRLRQIINEPNVISRLAGSEFVCLLRGYSRDQAIGLGKRAQAEISNFALKVKGDEFARVGLHLGVVEYPLNGQTVDELLHSAVVAARPNQPTRKHIELLADPYELHSVPSLRSEESESEPLAVNG
ncbi:MAG TPA: HD domain-containing phosphohydrolase [Blastocatellia bacterium]|jgi:diguanylate cyclase (GGDEF)-like protein/putative nucleotidyltransferase with HDIG domain|nr:HD domain-containing phosphohydrolase [Blastocatellia bacterium]